MNPDKQAASNVHPEPVFSQASIERQKLQLSQLSHFLFMRFEQEMEDAFTHYSYSRLLRRVPAIGFTGLVLFLLFCVLDYYTLPPEAYQLTIPIRLFVVCPLICLVIYLAYRHKPVQLFLNIYFCVYVLSGCSIIAIIYTAHQAGYPLAYDGMLLHLVFGYFLMGLPYLWVTYGSLLVSASYIWVASHTELPMEQLASNAIFLLSMNFMGAIGSYLQERSRRYLFLNENLVTLAKFNNEKEIAAKTRLVATASHDLKQPLHAMNLFIDALQTELTEPSQKSLAKSLHISIKQLSQMLNTLLDISRLNAGIVRAKPEALNVSDKIKAICTEFAFRAKEAGIELTCSGPEAVFSELDPFLFDRIVRNVLENVFVHAEATRVSVSWRTEQPFIHPDQLYQFPQQSFIHLSIRDNGKGIAAEDLNAIFEEFRQSGHHAKSGMGLGLSIVKQLAELQGIAYRIDSSLGDGTAFHLNLKASNSQQNASNPAISVAIAGPSASGFIEQWQDRFTEWGYRLTQVELHEKLTIEQLHQRLPQDVEVVMGEFHDKHALELFRSKIYDLHAQYRPAIRVLLAVTEGLLSKRQLLTEEKTFTELMHLPLRPAKLRLALGYLIPKG